MAAGLSRCIAARVCAVHRHALLLAHPVPFSQDGGRGRTLRATAGRPCCHVSGCTTSLLEFLVLGCVAMAVSQCACRCSGVVDQAARSASLPHAPL